MNPTIYVALMAITIAVGPETPIPDELQLATIKELLAGYSEKTEPQIQKIYDSAVYESEVRDRTDKGGLPKWSVLLTKEFRGLNGQSDKYKVAYRGVMSERIRALDAIPKVGSMREAIGQYAKLALGVEDNHLTMRPSVRSYLLFQDAMRNLRRVASQKILEQEVNENEDVIKKAGMMAGTIKSWTYVNLFVVAAILLVLVLGFTLWFCWVARAKRNEDSAQRARSDARAEREAEMRIAGHVANEVLPLVPTAPQPPRGRPYASRT